MIRQKSWIAQANEVTSIVEVLRSIDIYVPEGEYHGTSKKIHCPFGFYHSDGGIDKAMRVYYRSNTAYCFSCNKRYSPVSLLSAKNDWSLNTSALTLLENKGIGRKSLEQRWSEANTVVKPELDKMALADTLKLYCASICDNWNTVQLSDIVADRLNKCLDLLSVVHTDDDVIKWLTNCKLVMKKVLDNYAL